MTHNHMKRLSVPRTWAITRKEAKFIVRPRGFFSSSLPIAVILKDVLSISNTRRETSRILQEGKVSVDGKRIKDDKYPVGLMSIIKIENFGFYQMLLNTQGKMHLEKIEEDKSKFKLCKIVSKTPLKGNKIQLGFHDGRTILSEEKDHKLNDTIQFSIPDFKVMKLLKLQKNATAYLTGGSNVGKTGSIENISKSITIKINKRVIESDRNSVFVIDSKQK